MSARFTTKLGASEKQCAANGLSERELEPREQLPSEYEIKEELKSALEKAVSIFRRVGVRRSIGFPTVRMVQREALLKPTAAKHKKSYKLRRA